MSSPDRTHITLPEETVRGLSHCTCGALPEEAAIASLVEEWMRREHAKEVFAKWAGFIKAEDHPEWDTDEDIYNWVRASRRNERSPWDSIRPVKVGDPGDGEE